MIVNSTEKKYVTNTVLQI